METLLSAEEKTAPIVGTSIPRLDALSKVSGRALFADDLELPNMLYVKIKRSTFPHAETLHIDKEEAERLQGVRAVITYEDCPKVELGPGEAPVLAAERVRYVGEPVAAVAADTLDIAEDALERISVDYHELPAVFDPEIAMSENSPILHTSKFGMNIANVMRVRSGDVSRGFGEADIIVENRYTTQGVQHCQIGPVSIIAKLEDDGGITIIESGQSAYRVRDTVCRLLGLPRSKVRVIIPPYVGGWFGNKGDAELAAICALLSFKTERPVKCTLTREEMFSCTTTRHPSIVYIKDGVKRNGTIVAREIRLIYNGGAYNGIANPMLRNSIEAATSLYKMPHFKMDAYRAYTNQITAQMMRAPMGPQIAFAVDSQMDAIAEALGVDPYHLRLVNLLSEGDINSIGEIMRHVDSRDVLERVVSVLNPNENPKTPSPWRVGKSIALASKWTHGNSPGVAFVRLRDDGAVQVILSSVDVGQGVFTAIAQIVAQELGMPLEKIEIMPLKVGIDTEHQPMSTGASGSRQLFTLGNAVIKACQDLKSQIGDRVRQLTGVDITDIEFTGGRIHLKGSHWRIMDVRELYSDSPGVANTVYGSYLEGKGEFIGTGSFVDQTGNLDPETGQCSTQKSVSYYTHVGTGAEVIVNTETGQVVVKKLVVSINVGKAINPLLVEGQITGAAVMGLGAALHEEVVFENGMIINPDFKDYKILSSADTPEIDCMILEKPLPEGPFGAKGCGEAAIMAIAPAIVNAIRNATGIRFRDLPVTAEKVLAELNRLQ